MTRVRFFTPENGLASIFNQDGRPAAELLAEAEARIVELAPQIAAFLDAEVDTLLALGMRPEEEVFAECRALSDCALRIAETAGAAGQPALGEAARGIRAMIESLFTGGVWHSDALQLHVEAVALIARSAPPPEEQSRVLTRLQKMRERIGVME